MKALGTDPRNESTRKPNTSSLALGFIFAMSFTMAMAQTAPTGPSATIPPLPAPLGIPQPGPDTGRPYAPQPILQGGIILPLYAPNSPLLKADRLHEPERYSLSHAAPGRISNIVNIHNPSVEIHTAEGNTGTTVILLAGGGHRTLNVGPEGLDFVPFFANYGINTVIVRNRLRSDGYDPGKDGVADAQQAIRLVRAHAGELHLDPHRIGVMGFSAGGELAAAAAVFYPDVARTLPDPGDPLNAISARPDFVALVYPGPSPYAKGGHPPVPPDMPPSFLISGGSGDQVHAVWADEYFAAMLARAVPNLEMHIYAYGRHPGDPMPDGSHMSGGLSDRNGTPYGTWQFRLMDWLRDLGFLTPSGTPTRAARDVDAYLGNPH